MIAMAYTAEEERREGHNEGEKSMGDAFKEFLIEEKGVLEDEIDYQENIILKFGDYWKEFLDERVENS